MSDTLLFLHVLAAFCLVGGTVIYSAFVLGAPVNRPTRTFAEVLWGIGGLGTLILGIWLAIDLDGYDVFDGWIILAVVLWFLATGAGQEVTRRVQAPGNDAAVAVSSRVAITHWVRVLLIVALLVVMVWKPGA